jgi:transcriptional regulator with PAS, ATPase and Fis domain
MLQSMHGQNRITKCAQVISRRNSNPLVSGRCSALEPSGRDLLDNVTHLHAVEADADSTSGASHAKHLVFDDPKSVAMLTLLDRVAPSSAPVCISGETGTGKELIARYVHQKSRRTGPFLAVNCAAISEHLAESELFGHESGAFTGATGRRAGWFEAAHTGTLFLDEIGEMTKPLQSKLLRVLQESAVTRIGARRSTAVDVRIVSASNVDLSEAVNTGEFRRDLYYRLNTVPVQLAPLRDRLKDIDALSLHFVNRYANCLKRTIPKITPRALQALRQHRWPGNIRELENVIHFALLVAPDDEIDSEHLQLPSDEQRGSSDTLLNRIGAAFSDYFREPGSQALRNIERRLVVEAYQFCDSNQVQTSELLGVSRNVVRTLLKRYGLILEPELEDDCQFGALI